MFKRVLSVGVVTVAAFTVLAAPAGASHTRSALKVFHPPAIISSIAGKTVTSSNWSGYAATGSAFTEVQSTWVQPASKSCSSKHTYASFWVGIDGYADNSVEQLGTDSDCSGGSPKYYAWYEMYPAPSINLPSGHPVAAGDSMTARVTRSGNDYTLSITDATKSWTFSIVKSAVHDNASVEWIAESPEVGSSLAALTDFGKVSWTGSEAAQGGSLEPISSFTNGGGPFRIIKKLDGVVDATPSALSTGGQAFKITWDHS